VSYSGGDGLTGRVGGTSSGYDSQARHRDGMRGFVFDLGACMCHDIKFSSQGSRCGGSELVRASSEAESHLRGRPSLERGGTSREGAPGPRERRNLTRGGARPSSKAEPYPRGRPALERGGDSLVWCCSPRAKRSFARGWLGRLFLWAAGATRAVIILSVF
jgi:hypothetical protein